MPDPARLPRSVERMIHEVGAKQERMQRSDSAKESFWSSLSVLGVVGWSVTIPTLAGVVLGLWLDRHWPIGYSWTLMLLIGGLLAGCANAWAHIGGTQK